MNSYLLVLEVEAMEVGRRYAMLPAHCTLVHWFKLDPDREPDVKDALRTITEASEPIGLTAESEQTFTGMTKDGPIPVTVDTVMYTAELRDLHALVCNTLETLSVHYSYPSYVRDAYVPHVTRQSTGALPQEGMFRSRALYLIGADAPEYGNDRTVLARFELARS